ncbi:MAG TPA: hypothetical protein VIF38_04085 [Burkholderiales bacterium]|jgi:hypothetical protein
MKPTLIVGVVLITLGAAVLGYNHFNYTTTETVLQIGSIKATAEETHTVFLSPILGWLLVGGGACALAFAAMSKNKD